MDDVHVAIASYLAGKFHSYSKICRCQRLLFTEKRLL
jgi:hypothetical protein